MHPPSSPVLVDLTVRDPIEPDEWSGTATTTVHVDDWSAAQAAAVAAAEAIAAIAAAEVAAEAAATARAAVDVASAAAAKAAVKASEVAAQAVLAATAAATEAPNPVSVGDDPNVDREVTVAAAANSLRLAGGCDAAEAAAQVAGCVAAVAAAAATAAVEAATLIGEQLAKDVAAAAAAVAAPHPVRGAASCLADELRLAIGGNQLRLHFQPIMDLVTGQPVGVEALVRWQHPQRGLLCPSEFIEVAERTGLILPLGEWVLHEAARMAVRLQARGGKPLTVAVNMSAGQLSDHGLVATVRAALNAHGCRADRLVLEITETARVTDLATAIDSLHELRELGAAVALDDFGTGFCSVLYLKQLPIDDLKIDRAFISDLGDNAYGTALVASLISLAHSLNLRCVAEGVETVEQLQSLTELGCNFAQGYLFSRPVDEAALGVWLDQRPQSPQVVVAALHEQGAQACTASRRP